MLVTRHRYGGWNRAVEFSEQGRSDPSCREMDFQYNAAYTWEHYLRVPARQPKLTVLSLCEGADDASPFIDHNYGFERDIPALIDEWNRRGFGNV